MKKLEVKDLKDNFFEAIGKEWMLITAGTKEKFNTMTETSIPLPVHIPLALT